MLVRRLVGTIALAGAVSMSVACTPDRKRSSSGDGVAGVAADEEKLHRAQGDFLVRNGRYGNEDELVAQGFLAGASGSHDIVLENTGTVGVKPRYVVDCVTPGCGGPRRSTSFGSRPVEASAPPRRSAPTAHRTL